ncbi:MAG: response regulator transcription factor [Desulfobacteraceae bacterium]|nr:response regulator transcription factor [Desulfobacteraceae bacterium]
MTIKILLADDHKLIRDGLIALISNEKDMEVVVDARNGRDAVSLVKLYKPDIVIMDINMPGLNGIDATKIILEENRDVKVIALSIHSTTKFVKEMLKAGVSGYLVKHCAYEELAKAIRIVMNGKQYLSSEIVGVVMDDYASNFSSNKNTVFSTLTPREREILQLVAEGLKSDQIASRLFISVKTVSTHRRKIMKKLNLNSIAELTRYAISEGLVSQEY